MKKSIIVLFFFSILLPSCSKGDEVTQKTLKIYTVGSKDDGTDTNTGKAVLWTNDTPTFFDENIIAGESRAEAIYVDGSDIYVAINDYTGAPSKILKNGELYFEATANDVFESIFVSGNDVYVVGYVDNGTLGDQASVWINNVRSDLETTDEATSSQAKAIFVSGNDVYICGTNSEINDEGSTVVKAVYWNNGALTLLSDVDYRTRANQIFVSNGNVHIVGSGWTGEQTNSFHWENEFETIYDNVNFDGSYVTGNDVYFVGSEEEDAATLWINGVASSLEGDGSFTSAFLPSLYVYKNELYVIGKVQLGDTGEPKVIIWKNGEILYELDAVNNDDISQIVVIRN